TEPLLLLDVGGGSTEFILGKGEQKHFRASFAVGSVRLIEILPVGDPPTTEELTACRQWLQTFLQNEVEPKLQPAMQREGTERIPPSDRVPKAGLTPNALRLVGTGGTATILGRMEACLPSYDRQRIEATRLSQQRLRWHVEHLWRLPLEQRKQIIGLPANRADVILTGAAIYEAVMERFAF